MLVVALTQATSVEHTTDQPRTVRCAALSLLTLATELLKLFFGMLEDAEVLVDSENLSQLKAEYNIAGSARTGISANRGAARKQDLLARFPFLQVRRLGTVIVWFD